MASIVEWQSLRMQEYRGSLRNKVLIRIADIFDLFGVRRPIRFEPEPIVAGDYNHALHADHPDAPSLLDKYLAKPDEPETTSTSTDTEPGEEKQ
jgi:hypothetical protein